MALIPKKLRRPGLAKGLAVCLLWGLGIALGPRILLAGPSESLEERLQELEELKNNPLYQQYFGTKREGLSSIQKEILNQAVESMSDAEVRRSLKRLGLTQTGSSISRRMRLRIALGIESVPELPRRKKKARISIENANEGEYIQGAENGRGMLKLEGRIRVRTPNGVFTADRVIVDTKRQEIYGEGNVIYTSGRTTLKAERIIYSQVLQSGILYNAAAISHPVFVIGKSIRQVRERRFTASHAWFTSNSAPIPHYHFTARRLWLYEDNTVFAAGVWYHVGGVPLLPLPFVFASDWGSGIISQIGHSDVQGWFWENTYQFSDPNSIYSSWRPSSYKFKADWQERVGELFGMEFFRSSPGLNYYLDLDVARYKRYEIIGDYREKDNIEITNQVKRSDGTIGRDYEKWFKIFAIVNFRVQNRKDNVVRNFYLFYEDYKHPLFDYEFGGRYVPENTGYALYRNSEATRGLIHATTNWKLTYTENRGDLSIRVGAERNRAWNVQTGFFENGKYDPTNDIAPQVEIGQEWELGRLPATRMPVFWTHKLYTDLTKEYSLGKEFKNLNHNQYETSFYSMTSFYPWISFEPRIGYGIQKVIPDSRSTSTTDDATLRLQAAKDSYQYWFSENRLTFGPDELSLAVTHRFKDSFKEDQNDAPVVNITGFTGNQKVNETELLLTTKPFWNTEFSVNAIYDMRDYPDKVESRDRWSYPVFRADILFDFFNLGRYERENLLSRNKVHFLELHLTDDYVYDPVLKRDHSNLLGLNFEMGGFDLWLLKRLRYFEMGYYWYHVYFNPALDHMRYTMKLDVQLWEWGYLEMSMDSRATDIGRYSGSSKDATGKSNHVPFTRDIANGIGLNGRRKREEAVFNVSDFEAALILDVEDFEYRIGYQLRQRSMFAGTTSVDFVTYYDNRVFFSLSFIKFDLKGGSSRSSRYWLYRDRLRPDEVGRQPVEIQ